MRKYKNGSCTQTGNSFQAQIVSGAVVAPKSGVSISSSDQFAFVIPLTLQASSDESEPAATPPKP